MGKQNKLRCYDTTLGITTDKISDRGIYAVMLMTLRRHGFSVVQDKSVSRIIRRDFHVGERGDLKFHAHHYPTGCQIEFYQDLVTENPNGGRYDFDKEAKMPYLIRKRFQYEMRCLKSILAERGYTDTTPPTPRDAWEKVEIERQSLRDFQGQSFYDRPLATYNATDADKRQLQDGDVRWFYSRNRLHRGVIRYHINNMWWVVSGGRVHNIACFRLFTYDAAKHPSRYVEDPVRRIKTKLARAVEQQDFERAIGLRDALNRLQTPTTADANYWKG